MIGNRNTCSYSMVTEFKNYSKTDREKYVKITTLI